MKTTAFEMVYIIRAFMKVGLIRCIQPEDMCPAKQILK